MFIPNPYRQQLHKYHSMYMFALRVVLTCVLGVWILYLLLFNQNETVSIFTVTTIITLTGQTLFYFSLQSL